MAALDVTEVTQPLEKGLVPVGASGPIERQVAYSGNLGRWLRLGAERRGEEGTGQGLEKRPPINPWSHPWRSLTEGL